MLLNPLKDPNLLPLIIKAVPPEERESIACVSHDFRASAQDPGLVMRDKQSRKKITSKIMRILQRFFKNQGTKHFACQLKNLLDAESHEPVEGLEERNATYVKKNWHYIHNLTLDCFTQAISPEELRILLDSRKNLRILNLSYVTNVGDLVPCIDTHKLVIKHLAVYGCELSQADCQQISDFIREAENLKKLSLVHDKINGIINIGGALQHYETLDKLDLSRCKLGVAGVDQFFDAMVSEGTTTIKKLNLSDNDLSGDALVSFLTKIRNSFQVSVLNLNFNPLNFGDCCRIVSLYNEDSSVKRIILNQGFMTSEQVKDIHALATRETLEIKIF